MGDSNMSELGELENDKQVIKQIDALRESTSKIDSVLELMIEGNAYESLDVEDKIKHDLFVSYSLSSLYWMYLRTVGEDPSKHVVKSEIERIQEYVKKYQRVKDRKKAPRLEKDTAKRFIKSGLWDPNAPPEAMNKRKNFDN